MSEHEQSDDLRPQSGESFLDPPEPEEPREEGDEPRRPGSSADGLGVPSAPD